MPKENLSSHIGRCRRAWFDLELIGSGASRTVEKGENSNGSVCWSWTEDPDFLKGRELFRAGGGIDGQPPGRETVILAFAFHPKITRPLKNGYFVRPLPINGMVNSNTAKSEI